MFGLGPSELLIVGIVAIMLFGKRLPEVARSLGKSYRDLRSGLQDLQSQFHDVDREYRSAVSTVKRFVEDDHDRPTAPRYEPPTTDAPKFSPPPFTLPSGAPQTVSDGAQQTAGLSAPSSPSSDNPQAAPTNS